MAWLRIDDGAIINQKIGRLTDREYRSLHALWAYCARAKNEGLLTLDDLHFCLYITSTKPQTTTPTELKKFIQLGLIDAHEDGETFQVHDWSAYQPPADPTAAQRMRRHRDKLRQTQNAP